MITPLEEFLTRWYKPFRKVHEGLNFLSGYAVAQMGNFHPGSALTFEQRVTRQENWFRNLSGMEEIDKRFFQ
jgi:hypothetical protein